MRSNAHTRSGRVLQVDRTTHAFAAGVQPARNINPGGAAADLARDVASMSAAGKQYWTQSELSFASRSAGTRRQRAVFGQHETRFFAKKRPSTGGTSRSTIGGGGGGLGECLRSRSMYAQGTWNDMRSERSGGGPDVSEYFPAEPPARPASAGGISVSLSSHHPFERSFQHAPKAGRVGDGGGGGGGVSFWGEEEEENPAATHPGIDNEDIPTFANTGRDGGSWDRPASPPFASHHHARVDGYEGYEDPQRIESGQYSSVFANTTGILLSPQDRDAGAEMAPSWMSEMSLLDATGGEASYGGGRADATTMLDQTWMSSDGPLTDDVRTRAVDRRETSYVDVLGQRPMPLDTDGVLAWGSAHAKEV